MYWHNTVVIMAIRSGKVNSRLTHWVGDLHACTTQQNRTDLLCRDRFPVDIAFYRAVIFKATQQEHSLRTLWSVPVNRPSDWRRAALRGPYTKFVTRPTTTATLSACG